MHLHPTPAGQHSQTDFQIQIHLHDDHRVLHASHEYTFHVLHSFLHYTGMDNLLPNVPNPCIDCTDFVLLDAEWG